MGQRHHLARYPKYAMFGKRAFGPCPKWLKRFHWTLVRRNEREALANDEEPEPLKKGRIQNMWY